MDPKVKILIEWIAENSWRESRSLSPNPSWHVELIPLLDTIRDTFGVPEDQIGEILDTPDIPAGARVFT